MLSFSGDRCSLLIDKVNQSDRGVYKVIARNPHGEAVTECTLEVEGRSFNQNKLFLIKQV